MLGLYQIHQHRAEGDVHARQVVAAAVQAAQVIVLAQSQLRQAVAVAVQIRKIRGADHVQARQGAAAAVQRPEAGDRGQDQLAQRRVIAAVYGEQGMVDHEVQAGKLAVLANEVSQTAVVAQIQLGQRVGAAVQEEERRVAAQVQLGDLVVAAVQLRQLREIVDALEGADAEIADVQRIHLGALRVIQIPVAVGVQIGVDIGAEGRIREVLGVDGDALVVLDQRHIGIQIEFAVVLEVVHIVLIADGLRGLHQIQQIGTIHDIQTGQAVVLAVEPLHIRLMPQEEHGQGVVVAIRHDQELILAQIQAGQIVFVAVQGTQPRAGAEVQSAQGIAAAHQILQSSRAAAEIQDGQSVIAAIQIPQILLQTQGQAGQGALTAVQLVQIHIGAHAQLRKLRTAVAVQDLQPAKGAHAQRGQLLVQAAVQLFQQGVTAEGKGDQIVGAAVQSLQPAEIRHAVQGFDAFGAAVDVLHRRQLMGRQPQIAVGIQLVCHIGAEGRVREVLGVDGDALAAGLEDGVGIGLDVIAALAVLYVLSGDADGALQYRVPQTGTAGEIQDGDAVAIAAQGDEGVVPLSQLQTGEDIVVTIDLPQLSIGAQIQRGQAVVAAV